MTCGCNILSSYLSRFRKIGWVVTLAAIFISSLANGIKSHVYEANPVYAL